MGKINSVLGISHEQSLAVAELKLEDWRPVDLEVRDYRSAREFMAYQVERPRVLGVGMNFPLAFSTGIRGWRPADFAAELLDSEDLWCSPSNYADTRDLVLAIALRQRWPDLPLTETAARSLFHVLTGAYRQDVQPDVRRQTVCGLLCVPQLTVVSRDGWPEAFDAESAAMAALAIWKGLSGEWPRDLHRQGQTRRIFQWCRDEETGEPVEWSEPLIDWTQLVLPVGPVHFFWPQGGNATESE